MKPSAVTSRDIIWEYIRYSQPYRGLLTVYLLALPLAVLATAIAVPYLTRGLVDLMIATHNGGAVEGLGGQINSLLLGIGGALSIGVLFRLVADLAISQVNPFVFRDIENDCYQRLIRHSYGFFSDVHTGSLVAKIKRYVDAYEGISFNLTRGVYCTFLHFVFTVVMVSRYSWPMSLGILVWGCVFVSINLKMLRWKMSIDTERAARETKLLGRLADSLSNFFSVKIFSKISAESADIRQRSTAAAQYLVQSWRASTMMNVVEGTLMAIVQILVFVHSVQLWKSGDITIGTIVMIQTYLIGVCALLAEFSTYNKAIYRGLASAIEMSTLLRMPYEVRDPEAPVPVVRGPGSVEFKNIEFSYPSTMTPLFHGFSLKIEPGERVAIVGSSGAGKSTLVKLLLRFVDPQSGAITIDNQRISDLRQDDLRSLISFVPQETALFHRSIYENIAFGAIDPTREEVEQAARGAYIYDFIMGLPQGFETLVGERGIKLSGGERQRIAIARAMLRSASILILDEATNSLDALSEQYVQLAFSQLMQGRTSIVIAHRLATIQMMDRIVVLEGGTIVESGTHRALLEQDGVYRRLWAKQS